MPHAKTETTKTTALRMPIGLWRRLRIFAARTDQKMYDIHVQALTEFLDLVEQKK